MKPQMQVVKDVKSPPMQPRQIIALDNGKFKVEICYVSNPVREFPWKIFLWAGVVMFESTTRFATEERALEAGREFFEEIGKLF